jgi:hypothetical protein
MCPIEQITTRQVEQYKARALKSGLSRKTINNHLSIFRTCMTTAYDWLQLQGAPPKIGWLKVQPPVMDYLSPDECTVLLSHAHGIVREMILTALRTGMRQGELKGLQWSSIDWQNQSIAIRHSRCDYSEATAWVIVQRLNKVSVLVGHNISRSQVIGMHISRLSGTRRNTTGELSINGGDERVTVQDVFGRRRILRARACG